MSDWSHGQERSFGFARPAITYSVQLLILVNAGVFALQLLLDIPFGDSRTYDAPGGNAILHYVSFSSADFMRGWVWTAFTYMFFHGGLMHLFGNMLMLYFFGTEVERVLGTRQFLRFYFACGFLGVLLNLVGFAAGGGSMPIIGASGAVLGVTVAFAFVYPDKQIFLFPIPFPVTARGLVLVIIAMNLLSAAGGRSGTSVATHFGGMAVGFAFMKLRPSLLHWSLKRRSPKKRDVKNEKDVADAVDNIFDFRGRKRR